MIHREPVKSCCANRQLHVKVPILAARAKHFQTEEREASPCKIPRKPIPAQKVNDPRLDELQGAPESYLHKNRLEAQLIEFRQGMSHLD